MRVVGSLTTIPGRYKKLLRTLQSLRDQDYHLDAIYLSIPYQCRRLNQPYEPIPVEISNLCNVVHCDEDYGPCTKIIGSLLREDDPTTIIFTFDDDVIYSPTIVSSMLDYHKKYPNIAIGSSGILIKHGFPFYTIITNSHGNWNFLTGLSINTDGLFMDILCGFSSILYTRGFFPITSLLVDEFLKYPLLDDDVYMNDDIMISAYLERKKIDRKIFGGIPKPLKRYDQEIDDIDVNAISFDKIIFLNRFRRALIKMYEWDFFTVTYHIGIEETGVGYYVFALFLFIALIICVCVYTNNMYIYY